MKPPALLLRLISGHALYLKRIVAWVMALVVIASLAFFRIYTYAEYALASLVIIPIFWVSWLCGLRDGLMASLLASVMWIVADSYSGREFEYSWIPYVNGVTRLLTYSFVSYMVATVHHLHAKEVERATHDALTGLLNRRSFYELGMAETNRAKRYRHSLAIIFLDLDNFKLLNDTRGHSVGDDALKAVANALSNSLRSTDKIARLGGDEFAILLPELKEENLRDALKKLETSLAFALVNFSPVTVSVGVGFFKSGYSDFEEMLRMADALMYEIKKSGKRGTLIKSFEVQT